MNESLMRELQDVKDTLRRLQQRIAELERQTATLTPSVQRPSTTAPVVPAAPPRLVVAQPETPNVAVPETSRVPATPPSAPLAAPNPAAPTKPCPQHAGEAVQWYCAMCGTPLCLTCGGVAFQGAVRCWRCDRASTAAAAKSKTAPAAQAAPQPRVLIPAQ